MNPPSDKLSLIAAKSGGLLAKIEELRASLLGIQLPPQVMVHLGDVTAVAKEIDKIATAPQP